MSDDRTVPGGTPEYLDRGTGSPLPPTPPRHRGRTVLVGAAAAGLLAFAGAGTWAAVTLMGGGPQPAEALPASTVAYLSLDIDPSASQKVEAVRMAQKFPALDEELGLDAQDDLRRELYDWIQDDAACTGIEYDADIEPWLGDRVAVAAVDTGGPGPDPVLVLQVRDEAAAEEGLAKIRSCAQTGDADTVASGESDGAWVVTDGWAVVAEDETTAQKVVDAADEATLADDTTYQRWQGELGEPGIVTMYAAPGAGPLVLDLAQRGALPDQGGTGLEPVVPEESRRALEDFGGMAGTVRFTAGSLEMEVVADPGDQLAGVLDGDGGAAALVGSLPEDTAVAMGVSLADGWVPPLMDGLADAAGVTGAPGELTGAELMQELSAETGLDLPADLETLAGQSMALSLGSGLDLEALVSSTDGSEVPLAAKIQGDATAIERVLDTIRTQLPADQGELVGSDSTGDTVVIGPSPDYRAAVLSDGGLGDVAAFGEVIREDDQPTALLYVDFDAGDNWLVGLAEGADPETAANLEPLSALGLSAWNRDDAMHLVLRLTTD